MTIEQKDYIEENIDLIENEDWEEFFKNAPDGVGACLYSAGIDFMSEMKAVPAVCFAFTNIKNVTIPNSVTSIGRSAFWSCKSLTSINIPDSVKYIGSGAFRLCTSLTSITIPYGVTFLTCTFRGCTSLTSITIPNSVTLIAYDTFYDCSSLTSITIPSSVTSIEEGAFENCSRLQTVNFTGTSMQWRAIKQSKNTFRNVPALRVICSDGVTKLLG